ncbi:transposable element Tc3 transposase [Trichonephila clavipes]|nr:transposable element Tc3 transposase [Trichonephila clavipes]
MPANVPSFYLRSYCNTAKIRQIATTSSDVVTLSSSRKAGGIAIYRTINNFTVCNRVNIDISEINLGTKDARAEGKGLGVHLSATVALSTMQVTVRPGLCPFQFGETVNNLVALHFKHDQARRTFVEWAQNEIAVVPDFHERILFSDEAHFWLNGYVNKQNCRIGSEANPQVYVETPLHPEKLTVWCALWAGGIIGPYFFKNDEGHNELWFQQDGATCHTARATIDLLKDTFGDRLISRFGPVNWPPRSCDLKPLDYFLWGYVKSLVYVDKPQTLDHFEDNFRRVNADIRPQMLEKAIENWTSRLDYIRASRGSPMPVIIFEMSVDRSGHSIRSKCDPPDTPRTPRRRALSSIRMV